jgi:glycosyltransferase involved in cell wall biosynthesis
MRILIISTFFPPLNSIASQRPYSWAKYFRDKGASVTVLTTDNENLDPNIHTHLPMDNIEVISVPNSSFLTSMRGAQQQMESKRSGGLVARIRNKTGILSACRMPDLSDVWARKALAVIKQKGKWDVVISTSGPYSVHYIGYRLTHCGLTSKWFADYRDLWTNHEFYQGLFPFTLIEKKLEQRWLKRSDAIITVSRGLCNELKNLFPAKPIKVITNGFDPMLYQLIEAPVSKSKFRIVYTGSIYNGTEDPKLALTAIRALITNSEIDANNIEVLFYGKFNADLEQLIDQLDLSRICKQMGMVNMSMAFACQQSADVLLFFKPSSIKNTGIITGKLFEYINSGTPILVTGMSDDEEAMAIILETQTGFNAHNDIEQVKRYLTNRYHDIDDYEPDQNAIKKYQREYQAALMYKLISQ